MPTNYTARRVERISAPAAQPVSLSEAKNFLRIDSSDEDALISDMITAAIIMAEEQTASALITQSWRISYDHCPPAVVNLPNGPVQEVTSVKSVAENGAETIITATTYHLNAVQDLVFEAVPSGQKVVVEYVSGFGDLAGDVPTDIAQAILLHVAHLYEHRDNMTPPLASQLSYARYREVRL